MRDKTHRTFVLSLLIALGLAAAIGVPLASGQIAANPGTAAEAGWAVKSDKRSHPLGDRALDLRMQAAQAKAKGAAVDDDRDNEPE